MDRSKWACRHSRILLTVIIAIGCVTHADTVCATTVYDVSGTFFASGPSNPLTGPLNGGTFSGMFTATLPTPAVQVFTTFDINLFDSSGALLFSLTPSNAVSGVQQGSVCVTGPSTTGPCDVFDFETPGINNFLQLVVPRGFTGGAVIPGFNLAGVPSFAGVGGVLESNQSFVESGTITSTPEPNSLMLFGSGIVACGWMLRRRVGIWWNDSGSKRRPHPCE